MVSPFRKVFSTMWQTMAAYSGGLPRRLGNWVISISGIFTLSGAAFINGVTLVVDDVSIDLVRGSAVDFVSDLGGQAFKVTNPNATAGCGCGTSFSV